MFINRSRSSRLVGLTLLLTSITIISLLVGHPKIHYVHSDYSTKSQSQSQSPPQAPPQVPAPQLVSGPKYLPVPTWTPPPVKDPFPLLSTSNKPPPIPSWNMPKKNLHKKYNLDYAPPLFIGFTRAWPLLLQAVVSYITAGWPAHQIYVIENTGVQRANLDGKLSLQNPFFLNHTQLEILGVNVIRTPVLMNFAQLQNFYVHLSHEHQWPYYFWSHMDILALSYEDGNEHTPPATDPEYKTIYELALAELNRTTHTDERWADRLFAYDHLTLVNREAYEAVGGWDTFIPYYITDCDMHSRLLMHNWTQVDARAGIITDVSTVLDDLLMLYRDRSLSPSFTDPNPPAPDNSKRNNNYERSPIEENTISDLEYWKSLQQTADKMFHHKHGDRGRNVWQVGQRGGQGEPYYYDTRGIEESILILTEAGKEIYRKKWGHRDCDLIEGAGLKLEDQWLVEQDW